MATINNSDTIRRILDDAGIQTSIDDVPKELASKVVPVLISNPISETVIKSGSSSTTGGFTIYTTPSNKDFYLTSIQFHVIKDVVCNMATGSVTVLGVKEGRTAEALSRLGVITLTAQDDVVAVAFPNPIKLDRDSTISSTVSYAAGVMVRTVVLSGLLVDKRVV